MYPSSTVRLKRKFGRHSRGEVADNSLQELGFSYWVLHRWGLLDALCARKVVISCSFVNWVHHARSKMFNVC